MIGALRGTLLEVETETVIVLDVAGVGYRVTVTPQTASDIAAAGEAALSISTQVREDAIVLFGFMNANQRRAFDLLLGAHGVGPNLAMAILSQLSVEALADAVSTAAVTTLCTVPGGGTTSAERLVVDLREKFSGFGGLPTPRPLEPRSDSAELRDALESLGFTAAEVARGIEDADPELSLDAQIRSALKRIASRS
jgi:Holliday junction DNA helicase RuvA